MFAKIMMKSWVNLPTEASIDEDAVEAAASVFTLSGDFAAAMTVRNRTIHEKNK